MSPGKPPVRHSELPESAVNSHFNHSSYCKAMSGHHAVAFDGKIFIFGGDEGAQNGYCCLAVGTDQHTVHVGIGYLVACAAEATTLSRPNGHSSLHCFWAHSQAMAAWYMHWRQLESWPISRRMEGNFCGPYLYDQPFFWCVCEVVQHVCRRRALRTMVSNTIWIMASSRCPVNS